MLQAFLVIAGLGAWAFAAQGGASPQDVVAIGVSLVVAVAVAARVGWLGPHSALLPRFFRAVAQTPARLRAKASGALAVARAAVSADVTLKPGLIKLALRQEDPVSRAAAAAALSEAPGAIAVALGEDAVLVHALDEDRLGEERLRRRLTAAQRRSTP